jgi:predicted nucleic acid-binding protein
MNGLTDGAPPPLYVFDTNVIIKHLNDETSILGKGKRFVSVITEMEVLAKPHIPLATEEKALRFLKGFSIVPLSNAIKYEAIRIRRDGSPRLKLPDAGQFGCAELPRSFGKAKTPQLFLRGVSS